MHSKRPGREKQYGGPILHESKHQFAIFGRLLAPMAKSPINQFICAWLKINYKVIPELRGLKVSLG